MVVYHQLQTKKRREGMNLINGFLTLICANCAQNIKKAMPNEEKRTKPGQKTPAINKAEREILEEIDHPFLMK